MASLPTGPANAAVLKEYFSSYGDLTAVDLADVEALDDDNSSDASGNCSARVTLTGYDMKET